MIRKIINDKFGIELRKATVNRLLDQLGLSAQKPLWRAYQQNPEAVEAWIMSEYPKIRRMAAKTGETTSQPQLLRKKRFYSHGRECSVVGYRVEPENGLARRHRLRKVVHKGQIACRLPQSSCLP